MKTRNYLQLAALTLGVAMTVTMSSCARDDNPVNATFDTTGPVINLSQINDVNAPSTVEGKRVIIVMDGQTLTGKLQADVELVVNHGARVTFRDVNINGDGAINGSHPGITCLGDACFILPENTENVVRGFGFSPGILIRAGSTLSIEGSGSLNPGEPVFAKGIGIDWYDSGGSTPIVGAGSGGSISPLYVLDGIELKDLLDVDFDVVKSISVPKDLASNSHNGAIIISTIR